MARSARQPHPPASGLPAPRLPRGRFGLYFLNRQVHKTDPKPLFRQRMRLRLPTIGGVRRGPGLIVRRRRRPAATQVSKRPEECRLIAPENDASSRVVLITGASRGIGRAAALAFARRGRSRGGARAHARGARGARRRNPRPPPERGQSRDARPARPARPCGDRPARRGDLSTLGTARRLRRQRRDSRRPVSAASRRSEGMGRRSGGQRHRQLAPHPLARSAAAQIAGGTGGVRHLGRREPGGLPRLLGSLCDRRRPRSTPSPAPTPPRRSTPPTSASCWSIRGRCAR